MKMFIPILLMALYIPRLYIIVAGYRPHYKCKTLPNETAVNSTDAWREYGQCSIKTYTNTSDGVTVSETSCENGWEYDIPVEQSFVTQASIVNLTDTVKNLKFGTPQTIAITVLKMEKFDVTLH